MELAGSEVAVVTCVTGSEGNSDDVNGFATDSSDFFEGAFEERGAFWSLSNRLTGVLLVISSSVTP